MRYYVDITGISDAFLEFFLGLTKVASGSLMELYVHVGTHKFISLAKNGKRCLYVDDPNDAQVLKDYKVAPCPPWH